VFKAVGQRIYINVELTNNATPLDDLPVKVADLVKQYELTQKVFFSSFHPFTLLRIKNLLPEVPIGLLAVLGPAGRLARGLAGRMLGYQSLNPEHQDVTQKLVEVTHKRGCKLLTWTVNEPEEMQRLFMLGVDGIITDDPLRARQVLESYT
jgi:glycerophosphoryl diester phosphodiesterase